MIIRDALDKIKGALLSVPRELFVGVIVVLVGTASFGLGRLSSQEIARTPVRILYPEGEGTEVASGGRGVATAAAAAALKPSGAVVASSKGTKYHFSWCPGAKSISEKNKISFESAALAESAGYTLAANCK